MPAFYHRPRTVDDIVNHTVARILDRLGVDQDLVPEWTGRPRGDDPVRHRVGGGCPRVRSGEPALARPPCRRVFDRVVRELGLSAAGEPVWRVFPGEGGVTGLLLLTESHLACHTFPERGFAAFNLYCCRPRDGMAVAGAPARGPRRHRRVGHDARCEGCAERLPRRAARPAARPSSSRWARRCSRSASTAAPRSRAGAPTSRATARWPPSSRRRRCWRSASTATTRARRPSASSAACSSTTGPGTWDEWLMGFADGSWAWLSEAQGRFHYMGQAAAAARARLRRPRGRARRSTSGPPGTFVVAEVRAARASRPPQGELPFAVAPGSELHYADLSGPGRPAGHPRLRHRRRRRGALRRARGDPRRARLLATCPTTRTAASAWPART